MFDFVSDVIRDFAGASSIEKVGFVLSLSGLITIAGGLLAFLGLRNRRAQIDALRRDVMELQSERDKAERNAAAARVETRLWNPNSWLEEAALHSSGGNEEKAMQLIQAGLERIRTGLARAAGALAGHHLSQVVGPHSIEHLEYGEQLARLSATLDPEDSDAAFLAEEAALARGNGSVEDIPLLPGSFAPTDLGEVQAVVDAINFRGQHFIESGSYRLALRLFRRSLLLLRRGRMTQGFLAQIVRLKIAQCLFFCGRFDEAKETAVSLLADQERVLRMGDGDLLRTRVLLADIIANQGHHEAALSMLREALAAVTPVDNQDEIDVLAAQSQEACFLALVRQPQEALSLATALLPRVSAAWGTDHANTLATRHHIIYALTVMERHAEALDSIDTLLPDQKRVLGENHPYVLMTRLTQADAEAGVGNFDRAIMLSNNLIPDMQRALGDEHPYVQRVIDFRDNLVLQGNPEASGADFDTGGS